MTGLSNDTCLKIHQKYKLLCLKIYYSVNLCKSPKIPLKLYFQFLFKNFEASKANFPTRCSNKMKFFPLTKLYLDFWVCKWMKKGFHHSHKPKQVKKKLFFCINIYEFKASKWKEAYLSSDTKKVHAIILWKFDEISFRNTNSSYFPVFSFFFYWTIVILKELDDYDEDI